MLYDLSILKGVAKTAVSLGVSVPPVRFHTWQAPSFHFADVELLAPACLPATVTQVTELSLTFRVSFSGAYKLACYLLPTTQRLISDPFYPRSSAVRHSVGDDLCQNEKTSQPASRGETAKSLRSDLYGTVCCVYSVQWDGKCRLVRSSQLVDRPTGYVSVERKTGRMKSRRREVDEKVGK